MLRYWLPCAFVFGLAANACANNQWNLQVCNQSNYKSNNHISHNLLLFYYSLVNNLFIIWSLLGLWLYLAHWVLYHKEQRFTKQMVYLWHDRMLSEQYRLRWYNETRRFKYGYLCVKHRIPHPWHSATQNKETKNMTLDITEQLPVETYKSLKTK